MASCLVSELKEGMVVATDVHARDGRLLVRGHSMLSVQMINQLSTYGVYEVSIVKTRLPEEAKVAIEKQKQLERTYIARVLNTPEYKLFKKNYSSSLETLEEGINNLVVRNAPLNEEQLIRDSVKLVDSSSTTYQLLAMIHALKTTDDSTFVHSMNVAIISRLMGMWLEKDKEQLDMLTLAGLLHDVGKCQVPKEILLKNGTLTEPEFETMKMHTTYGYGLLKRQGMPDIVCNVAMRHHERYDGSGYPMGLSGNELKQAESIVAIADVYDAMTSPRVYRTALCPFEVIANYEREGLQKFNPKYISLFLQKIADSFLNCEVLLNDGNIARIIYNNHNKYTRPIVQYRNNTIVKLEERPDLYIQAVI